MKLDAMLSSLLHESKRYHKDTQHTDTWSGPATNYMYSIGYTSGYPNAKKNEGAP